MRTILLVDDDELLIMLFSRFFEDDGWKVLTAPGGRECLELLGRQLPDLVLLAIMMKPMDGWETLLRIKENPGWAKVPVAMLTGKSLSQKEFDSFGMLFEHYMLKPLHENKMISLSGGILEDYKNMHMVAGSAGDKGFNPSTINEYRAVHHRVRLNERIKATSTIQDIIISWDIPKDNERLKELERQFASRGVSFPIIKPKDC